MTRRSIFKREKNLNPKQHFFFFEKRKPVLKEKNNVCFKIQIQNLEITPVVQAASLPEAQVIAWYSLTKYL
jgi:hypothetical protein